MLEGLFSPWHLLIIAFAVFLFVGPKRVANGLNHLGRTARRLVDDDTSDDAAGATAQPIATPPPKRRSVAYRLGRRFKPGG